MTGLVQALPQAVGTGVVTGTKAVGTGVVNTAQTVGSGGRPHHALAYLVHTVPNHAVPNHTVPCHTVPIHNKQTIPTNPHKVKPYRTMEIHPGKLQTNQGTFCQKGFPNNNLLYLTLFTITNKPIA